MSGRGLTEDVFDDARVEYTKVGNFVRVQLASPTITLVKTNPYSIQQLLVNFD